MIAEFRAFIARGNVIDLAVAVIIGAAFGKIVTSLTEDMIMPLVGFLFGGADYSSHFILLSVPDGYKGLMTDYAALKKAGAAMIGYGAFLTAVINFLILAFIIFLLIRYATRAMNQLHKPDHPEAPDAPAAPTAEQLLIEIRDELRKGRADPSH